MIIKCKYLQRNTNYKGDNKVKSVYREIQIKKGDNKVKSIYREIQITKGDNKMKSINL